MHLVKLSIWFFYGNEQLADTGTKVGFIFLQGRREDLEKT
jgi:hypothetical protein